MALLFSGVTTYRVLLGHNGVAMEVHVLSKGSSSGGPGFDSPFIREGSSDG
jgi:hypothetical protein